MTIRRKVGNVLRTLLLPPARLLRAMHVRLPERVYRHLHSTGPFSTRLPCGNRVVLMSWGNKVENQIYWKGALGHEPAAMSRWLTLSRHARCILDIGANTGVFAFFAKATNPNAEVFAFEPIPRIAQRIQENRTVSGLDVLVCKTAVANQSGTVSIHDPGGENAYSASLDASFLSSATTAIEVPVTSVDAFCMSRDLTPDLMKIDVEGVESEVLLGAASTLRTARPSVICEWQGGSESHAEVAKMLRDLGYTLLSDEGMPLRALEHRRGHEDRNVLFIPQEREDRIKVINHMG